MFKIVKNSTYNGLVREVATLRDSNARLVEDIKLVEQVNESLKAKIAQQDDFLAASRTKINACADTKKHLRGQIEQKNAEIAKLKEQLTDLQFELKKARKEVAIPTSSGLRKPAAEQPAAEVPAEKPKRPRTYKKRTPKAGK